MKKTILNKLNSTAMIIAVLTLFASLHQALAQTASCSDNRSSFRLDADYEALCPEGICSAKGHLIGSNNIDFNCSSNQTVDKSRPHTEIVWSCQEESGKDIIAGFGDYTAQVAGPVHMHNGYNVRNIIALIDCSEPPGPTFPLIGKWENKQGAGFDNDWNGRDHVITMKFSGAKVMRIEKSTFISDKKPYATYDCIYTSEGTFILKDHELTTYFFGKSTNDSLRCSLEPSDRRPYTEITRIAFISAHEFYAYNRFGSYSIANSFKKRNK
ncbi:MAG TPA: hypothetical protein VN132_12980 [Bdellovibrio sp.]|nr:hypothetical protein [Bdellovibrio sp.]